LADEAGHFQRQGDGELIRRLHRTSSALACAGVNDCKTKTKPFLLGSARTPAARAELQVAICSGSLPVQGANNRLI
jgi:hypothetical protein